MQDVELLDVVYNDVPAVELPKSGGGTALFTDVSGTTAAASDVRNGKTFFDSSGTETTGTAPNVVIGTFNTGSGSGVKTLNVPYSGNGYPLEAVFVVSGGMYNNTAGGNTNWYNLIQRYAIGMWMMLKTEFNTAPTYTPASSHENTVTVVNRYKNSTTDSVTYASAGLNSANILTDTNSNSSNNGLTAIRFKNKNTVSYYVASDSYGLLANTDYDYMIRYSS